MKARGIKCLERPKQTKLSAGSRQRASDSADLSRWQSVILPCQQSGRCSNKPYQVGELIREQGEQMRREDVAEFVARKYGIDAVKGEIAGGQETGRE